jgi:hypothetical protein
MHVTAYGDQEYLGRLLTILDHEWRERVVRGTIGIAG